MTLRHRTRGRLLATVAGSSLLLAACGLVGDDLPTTATAQPVGDPVGITMSVWGDFGLDDLVTEYEGAHPGITITLESGNYNDVHDELQRDLVAGSGAPNIVAIGEDYIGKFAAQPDSFIDLNTLGADKYQDLYLDWKWAQGSTPDGSQLIGIGADVSGLALCYRRDLFENAGIAPDREAVAAAIGDTWEGFIALGRSIKRAVTPGRSWTTPDTLLKPVREQLGASYFTGEGELTLEPVQAGV